MRRVVVTGLGAVTPLGVGEQPQYNQIPDLHKLTKAGIRRSWNRLLAGHCGVSNIRQHDPRFADLPCQVAGVVPSGSRREGGWTASEWMNRDVCLVALLLSSAGDQGAHCGRTNGEWRGLPSMLWLLRRRL